MKIKPITPDWSHIEKHPTWSHISSRQLAKVLGVSLQTINNWKMREILPEPEPQSRFKGNKNYYRISKIRAWIENRPEEDIHWDWIKQHMPELGFKTIQSAIETVRIAYDALEVEKPLV